MADNAAPRRQGMISLKISNETMLYQAYMPFLKNGGLFIPTTKKYEMGEEVFMLLELLDETDKLPVAGTVVWKTPAAATGNKAAGVGVHFNEMDNGVVRGKIEMKLAEQLAGDTPTHTM
jgi:type IV pilus assembly protein PilZ